MLRSTCMHAPCRARLWHHGRARPPDLGHCGGGEGEQGAAALSWSSPPGSPAHSSISDLAGTGKAPNHIHTTLRWGRAPGKPSVAGAFWANSNTLATSCEELTHWKRPGC